MGVAGIGVISGTPGVRSEEGVAAYFGKGACPLVEIAAQGETSRSPKNTFEKDSLWIARRAP